MGFFPGKDFHKPTEGGAFEEVSFIFFRFAHLRYLLDIGLDPVPVAPGEANGIAPVWGEGVFGIGSFQDLSSRDNCR